jgi:ATP-dependent Zn protease
MCSSHKRSPSSTTAGSRVELSRTNYQTEQGIENLITMLLSGRAAEEVVLGPSHRTVGAGVGEQSDFARATRSAIDLELRYGFGALGAAQFSDRAIDMLLHDSSMVALVKKRLDKCSARARELITRNRRSLEAIAARLERTGYLDRRAIQDLLKENPVADSLSTAPPLSTHPQ